MATEVVRSEINPFDWAIKRLGMTRAEFSRVTGFGKPYLLRVGQGRHAQIGDRVLAALYSEAKDRGVDLDAELEAEYGTDDLQEAWENWVLHHRQLQTIPNPAKGGGNPFARLVKSAGGVARMAALLAVPDPLVERYSKGLTPRMPAPIRQAFEDMGYEHLVHLDISMHEWFARS